MYSELLRYKITYILITLNLVAYIFSALFSKNIIDMDMQTLVEIGALYGPLTVLQGEWWRLFTAMFLHGGMTHLLMNMFSLYLIGRGFEQYFDTKSYLSVYFFSGLIGGLVSLYVHPESVGVGASGAIFGMFGALAGFFLAYRKQIGVHAKSFMKEFGIILGVNLVLGFSIPSIDLSAHIGGLVIGFIGGFVLSRNPNWIWPWSVSMLFLIYAICSYLPGQYAKAFF